MCAMYHISHTRALDMEAHSLRRGLYKVNQLSRHEIYCINDATLLPSGTGFELFIGRHLPQQGLVSAQ